MSAQDEIWPHLPPAEKRRRLREVAAVFLRLGTIAFGGPAAHIAMMNTEIVQKRKWVDQQTFLDLLGAANLIPGPNSTELAIHLGYRRAGWAGLIAAGSCFILPAMLIVWFLASLYTQYAYLPQAEWLMYGIKPVIIAIVLHALWAMGKTAIKNTWTLAAALLALLLALWGMNELLLLLLCGLAVTLMMNRGRIRERFFAIHPLPLLLTWSPAVLTSVMNQPVQKVFWVFLKIGSVLYGSGYVLLAFLQADFVERWGVLNSQQLLDAVAIGQFTPGPVFTTATFVGYLIAGNPGAVAATIGIFLPAFLFVALTHRFVSRLRQSAWTAAFLDGVNAASLALMAAVILQLGMTVLIDWPAILITLASLAILVFRSINSAWLVLAGGALGLLLGAIQGT